MTQTVLLGDVCKKVTSGGTPSTKHEEYYDGNIPWLRTQEVNFGNIYSTEKTITEAGLKNSSAKLIPENSVIIAMYGATAGKSAVNKIPLTTNQACCNLIIDHDKADYRYVYYYLLSNYEKVASSAVGAAQQNLGAKQIAAMPISLPDLSTQKKIANILGGLDEKIELNRQMNETLEQMGQALFRHYFIDNPEAEKWEVKSLNGYVELVNGASYKSAELQPSSNALVTLKSVGRGGGFSRRGYKEYTGKMKDSQIVIDGDLVVAHTDLTQKAEVAGYPALVDGADQYDRVAISMDLVKVVPRSDELSSSVIYFLLKTRKFQDHKMGYISGSTVLHLNKKCIPSYEISLPSNEDTLRTASAEFDDTMEKIKSNNQQIQTLTTLRDTLLPRLISGKARI